LLTFGKFQCINLTIFQLYIWMYCNVRIYLCTKPIIINSAIWTVSGCTRSRLKFYYWPLYASRLRIWGLGTPWGKFRWMSVACNFYICLVLISLYFLIIYQNVRKYFDLLLENEITMFNLSCVHRTILCCIIALEVHIFWMLLIIVILFYLIGMDSEWFSPLLLLHCLKFAFSFERSSFNCLLKDPYMPISRQ